MAWPAGCMTGGAPGASVFQALSQTHTLPGQTDRRGSVKSPTVWLVALLLLSLVTNRTRRCTSRQKKKYKAGRSPLPSFDYIPASTDGWIEENTRAATGCGYCLP
jgi:hypothetical protein